MRIVLISGFILLILSGCVFFEDFDPSEITRIRHDVIEVEDTTGVLEESIDPFDIYYINESDLPYIVISDFVRFYNRLGVAPEITHSITNGRLVMHQDQTFDAIDQTVRRTMVINANTNKLSFNDPLFASDDEMFSETMYFEGTTVSGYEVENNFTEIHLEDYNFYIHEDLGNYYMPLHVLNLFIMPEFYSLYYHPELISLVHTTTISALESEDIDTYVPSDLKHASYDFLRLFIDYRYGLTHLNDSLDPLFENYEPLMMDEDLHYRGVRKFLLGLDDIHTYGLNNGYYMTSIDYNKEVIEEDMEFERLKAFESYYEERSEFCETYAFNAESLSENIYLVNIPTMNPDIVSDFHTFLRDLEEEPSTIVLDLRCNIGGELRSTAELLSLISSDDLTMERVYGDKDYYVKTTITSEKTFDFVDYYVLTSPITYSAANITARTIQDRGLGEIIGENSAGGSGGQFFTSLPSGKPFVYSAPLTFMTQDQKTYEFGVEVDYPLAFDEDDYYEKLLNIIEMD